MMSWTLWHELDTYFVKSVCGCEKWSKHYSIAVDTALLLYSEEKKPSSTLQWIIIFRKAFVVVVV